MPPSPRTARLLTLILIAAVGAAPAVSYLLATRSAVWSDGLAEGAGKSASEATWDALRDKMSSAGTPVPGSDLAILRLRNGSGRHTTIHVSEAQFTPTSMEPADGWRVRMGTGGGILVNSVDEHETQSGGMSGSVLAGCGAPRRVDAARGIGSVRLVDCNGAYRDTSGVRRLANAVIVAYASSPGQSTCLELLRSPSYDQATAQYLECMGGNVSLALTNLSRALLEEAHAGSKITTLVIPELATGNGGLPKKVFYDALLAWLLREISAPDAAFVLPEHVRVQVWRQATPQGWAETQHAVSDFVGALTQRSSTLSRARAPAVWSILGICASVVILGFVLLFTNAWPRLHSLPLGSFVLLWIGWSLAAFGLATGVQLADVLPGSWGEVPYAVVGAAAVCLAAYVERARKTFGDVVAR